jgi:hypothetical protein
MKINGFRYFSTCERGIAEGSKGRRNPLELLPGKLLEGPFHRSLQEAIALMGDLEEKKIILLYANHVPVAGCPNKL